MVVANSSCSSGRTGISINCVGGSGDDQSGSSNSGGSNKL